MVIVNKYMGECIYEIFKNILDIYFMHTNYYTS